MENEDIAVKKSKTWADDIDGATVPTQQGNGNNAIDDMFAALETACKELEQSHQAWIVAQENTTSAHNAFIRMESLSQICCCVSRTAVMTSSHLF